MEGVLHRGRDRTHGPLYDGQLVSQLGITVHDRMEAVSLVHADGVCRGAIVRSLRDGALYTYYAKSTVIATGDLEGFTGVYKRGHQ